MSKSTEKECDEEYKKIFEEKMKRKKFLRNYFQKQKSDPFRHALNEGGAVVTWGKEDRAKRILYQLCPYPLFCCYMESKYKKITNQGSWSKDVTQRAMNLYKAGESVRKTAKKFDSAIQRYGALQVSGFDYFKPTRKNVNLAIFFVIVPMAVYAYMIKTTRDAQECKYRRGEVAYRDRRHKFIG